MKFGKIGKTVSLVPHSSYPNPRSGRMAHRQGACRSPEHHSHAAAAPIAGAQSDKTDDDIIAHCCAAWNTLIDQPWKIMSIGRRDWPPSVSLNEGGYKATALKPLALFLPVVPINNVVLMTSHRRAFGEFA